MLHSHALENENKRKHNVILCKYFQCLSQAPEGIDWQSLKYTEQLFIQKKPNQNKKSISCLRLNRYFRVLEASMKTKQLSEWKI